MACQKVCEQGITPNLFAHFFTSTSQDGTKEVKDWSYVRTQCLKDTSLREDIREGSYLTNS